tara:strand:- start:251 stop:967 length:717 start_codon:yes stop_codon:yes gene_type:complete
MEESLWNDDMKILAVTTYNNKLYKEYAHRFEKTYNWDFPYTVYNEDDGMMEAIPECKAFVERNKNKFEGKDFLKDFWQDGVRFCYKVYAYTHAILNYREYDYVIGIDADSVFYTPMTKDFIKTRLYKSECMMTYLGRGNQYSECGFLGFNMKHPEIINYANEMKYMYDSDEIYNLNEQHDSYVWDHVRLKFEGKKQVKNLNIGDGRGGHVQVRSVLGKFYDHTKGQRKITGRSKEFKG